MKALLYTHLAASRLLLSSGVAARSALHLLGLMLCCGIAPGVSAKGKPEKVLALERKLTQVASDTARARIHCDLCIEYWFTDPAQALLQGQQCYQHALSGGDLVQQARALNVTGVVYGFVGSYETAAEYFYQALKLKEKIGDPAEVAATLSNIGVLYLRQEEKRKALGIFLQTVDILLKTKAAARLAISYNNIADCYNRLNLPDSALLYIRKSKELISFQDNFNTMYTAHHLGARALYLKGACEEALAAYVYLLRLNDIARGPDRNVVLAGVADVYARLGDSEEALAYAQLHVAETRHSASLYERHQALEHMAQILKQAGRYEEALTYKEDAQQLQDSLDTQRAMMRLQTLQVHYDLTSKQAENNRLQRANRLQYSLMVVSMILLGIALVLVILLIRMNRQRNLALKEIHLINRSLEQVVTERTRELTQRNEQLISYAYLNSHHVRGPLARLMGLVYLLKQGWWGSTTEELVDLIDVSASELDGVIREINASLSHGQGEAPPENHPPPS